MADTDCDGDGTADYNDQCSNDPSKINNCGGAGISRTTPTSSSTQKTETLVDGVFMPMRSMRTQWRSEDHAGLELH